MPSLPYQLWDVFTDRALSGNPLAVVPDAQRLASNDMQRIAREFNLSETSFLLPSDRAFVRARFFTPATELPMAGHPSVGTVYALTTAGRIEAGTERVDLELAIGPVAMELEWEGAKLERVWMNQGCPELEATLDDTTRVAESLGLKPYDLDRALPVQYASAGVPYLIVPVNSLAALGRAYLTQDGLERLMPEEPRGVLVVARPSEKSREVRTRMLGLAVGIAEDPATGSAHGPLGAYLWRHGALEENAGTARFVSHQGVEMGRPSRLEVRVSERSGGVEVQVGGTAVQVGEGRLFL